MTDTTHGPESEQRVATSAYDALIALKAYGDEEGVSDQMSLELFAFPEKVH